MATGKQTVYQQIEERIFPVQAEALAWGNKKKEEYKSADMSVKVDTNPVDATRRRWKTTVYLKS
jgi:mannose/cellobiose epimerase-like protein (N-acyl-D-glucosamine 2-epimerase family)